MVFHDTYSQPQAPDPVLSDELVLSLVRRHAPATHVTAVDESGGEARAYAIDDGLILKTQRPHRLRSRTSLAKEVWFLRHLASDKEISVPRVLGYGSEGAIEYICMTRMPGVAARQVQWHGPERAAMVRHLGRTLRRMHAVPQQPLMQSGLFPMDPPEHGLRARLAATLSQAVDAIETEARPWPLRRPPRDVAALALHALPEDSTRVALHSNPGPEHVFVDPRTGAFWGLIDFGDAYLSHPALDLRQWRAAADRTALMQGYVADGALSGAFLAIWYAGMIQAEMRGIAFGRQTPDAALNLRELLAAL